MLPARLQQSGKLMEFINYFGNEKCLDIILDLLENAELDDSLTIQIIFNLAALIARPAIIYHKSYMDEFGARII